MGYGVADTGVDFDFITVVEAHTLMKSDKAVFVDSRDLDDFKISHIATAYNFPANDIIFHPDKLDKSLIDRCNNLAKAGKLIVTYSDAGISGMKNRGHVSRCRHVSQYFVELGIDKESIRRLEGGVNRWKVRQLDGVLGDNRLYYAGALMTRAQASTVREEIVDEVAEAGDQPSDVAIDNGLKTEAAAEVWAPEVTAGESAACASASPAEQQPDAADATALELALPTASAPMALAPGSAPLALAPAPAAAAPKAAKDIPEIVTSPSVYRVLKGEVYKKASPEAEKIIKLDWKVDRLVRVTGNVFTGAIGGKWAELDVQAGEKKGWVYVEGPGFGPSTRKVVTEFLAA